MTTAEQKAKIVAAIEARGWFTCEIYQTAAAELQKDGTIKLGVRYATGGNRKNCWVKA